MQQSNESYSYFYDYFPQTNYQERSAQCNQMQTFPLRDISQDKSKVHCHVQPIPAPLPSHNSNIDIPNLGTTTSNIHPNIQCNSAPVPDNIPQYLPSTTNGIQHHQSSISSIEATSTSIQNTTARTQEMLVTFNNEVAKANKAENKKKRTLLRHLINPDEWVRNKNKKARMLGQAYKGWVKTAEGKYVLGAERKALRCGPPCECKRSEKGKELKCRNISERERGLVFEKTCALSWEAKKVWVQSHVEALEPRKQIQSKRHRTMSIAYYLPTCSGRRIRVCRNMFLSTLGRNRRQIESWIKEGRLTLPGQEGELVEEPKPLRNASRQKPYQEKRMKAREFLDSLQKTPSYNNSYSLLPSFKTGKALYNFYKKTVGESHCASTFVFFQEMKTKRIKLYKTKKSAAKTSNQDEVPSVQS